MMDDLKKKKDSSEWDVLPAGIDLDTIALIHRGENANVGFYRVFEGARMKMIGGFPVKELPTYFPELLSYMAEDSYFTLNSHFQSDWMRDRLTPAGYPLTFKAGKWLRYLNVCYADLDVGRFEKEHPYNLGFREAAYLAGRMMDVGDLPQASIIAQSGRGAYLLWLLHDRTNPEMSERLYRESQSERVQLYQEVNTAIYKQLKELAADRIKDAARIFRLPGSTNTKAQETTYYVTADGKRYITRDGKRYVTRRRSGRVKYLAQSKKMEHPSGNGVHYISQVGDEGVYTYTLDYLAKFFNIKPLEARITPALTWQTSFPDRQVTNKGSAPKRARGPIIKNKKRIDDFLVIERSRPALEGTGGFPQGRRRKSLTLYSSFLRGAGIPKSEALKHIKKMAKRCKPAYPTPNTNDVSLRDIIKDTYHDNYYNFSNRHILEIYSISAMEAEGLGLKIIIPGSVRRKRTEEKRNQPTRKEIRQTAIEEHVKIHGTGSLSYAKLAKLLQEKYGIKKVTRQRIEQDFKEMGIKRLKPSYKGDTKDGGSNKRP